MVESGIYCNFESRITYCLTDCLEKNKKMSIIKLYKTFITLTFIVTCLSNNTLYSQTEIQARAPRVVQTGERFQLVYTVNARSDAPEFLIPDAFRLLSGPGVSQSQQMEIINGKMTSSFTITYTYVVEAVTEGTHIIEPATIVVDGKKIQSNSVTIEVVKGTIQQQTPQKQGPQNRNEKLAANEDDFFVRVHVDRKSVYQGEAVVATLKLYTTLNLSGFEKVEFPKFTGFYKEDIETVSQIQLQRENVNGKIYQAGIVAKYLLLPQKNGIIEIDPFTIEAIVTERVRSNDPFESFFGGNVRRFKVGNSSPIVRIDVKPLPEPRPTDYTGGVGQIKIDATVSRNQLKTNEALNLKIKLSGTGNIRFVDNPQITFPSDFEIYDPKKDVNVKTTERGSTGVVLWDYVIIPRHAGKYTIPAFSSSYFDPVTKSYRKLLAGPFEIIVEQGAQEASQTPIMGTARQDVRNIGSDIRFIQTGNLSLKQTGSYFFGTPLFWLIYILPVLLFIIFLIIKRKQVQDKADLVKVRNKRAAKLSRNRLKSAKKFVKDNKDAQVYDEVLRALWQYLADKLAIDQSRLSRERVFEEMENKKVGIELITKVAEIADLCEMARYAPTTVKTESSEVYAQAVDLLVQLEKAIK